MLDEHLSNCRLQLPQLRLNKIYGDSVPTHMSQVPAAISPVPLLWGCFLDNLLHTFTIGFVTTGMLSLHMLIYVLWVSG